MKTGRIFEMAWIFLLLAASSEGTIFEFYKNSLLDFFQTLRDKKEEKKLWNVHHYHVHYYPNPVDEIEAKPLHAPVNADLEHLHSNSLKSMGWTDQEYPIPDPKIIYPSKNHETLEETSRNSRKMWSWDNNVFESNAVAPVEHQPVLVHVPFHQQIVFQQPAPKEEKKLSFLGAFFQKLRRIKNALFHEEKPHDDCEDKKDEETIPNKFNGYAVYVNSKANQRH